MGGADLRRSGPLIPYDLMICSPIGPTRLPIRAYVRRYKLVFKTTLSYSHKIFTTMATVVLQYSRKSAVPRASKSARRATQKIASPMTSVTASQTLKNGARRFSDKVSI